MPSPTVLTGHDWLGLCRRSAAGLRELLAQAPTSRERVVETGVVGEGGDRTLVIDRAAEDVVFRELERLHDDGARFTAVSEERGIVGFGDPGVLVVIDPFTFESAWNLEQAAKVLMHFGEADCRVAFMVTGMIRGATRRIFWTKLPLPASSSNPRAR